MAITDWWSEEEQIRFQERLDQMRNNGDFITLMMDQLRQQHSEQLQARIDRQIRDALIHGTDTPEIGSVTGNRPTNIMINDIRAVDNTGNELVSNPDFNTDLNAWTTPATIPIDNIVDTISYATYQQHQTTFIPNNKEQLMQQKLRLDKTVPLEEILRNTTTTYHEIVTDAYENNRILSSDTTFTKEDLTNSSYSYRRRSFSFTDENDHEYYFECKIQFIIILEEELLKDMQWSSVRSTTIKFGTSHLLEQIRNRYAFFDRPTSGLSNIIIDNYAPKLMYLTHLDQSYVSRTVNLPKTIYTISPWFAQYFGAQLVPSEQLCRILGYDLRSLKNLITKVKRKDYTVTFVGYGGTVVNTIHWLTEIMKVTQSVNLFKQIEIFEAEDLEISNLLRFPKNPYIENNVAGRNASKLRLLSNDELSLLSRSKPKIDQNRIDGDTLMYSQIGVTRNRETRNYDIKNKHIFYGAPDINTRASFEDKGHFISATHNGNDAHLWLNPTQDSDLQVESYGLIQLTPFFMNQLRLAIGFLETLASDDLDLKGPERLLLEYSFDGEAKLSTNRTYNFQLGNHNGNVTTEEDAANAW